MIRLCRILLNKLRLYKNLALQSVSNANFSLFLPYYPEVAGGPSRFMQHFVNMLKERNYPYTNKKTKRFSKVFFPIQYDIEYLKAWKKRGIKICQRLDGVYYASQYGEEGEAMNHGIQEIYKNLADGVIFQSEYSKMQCSVILGEVGNTPHKIIINGTDKKVFYPAKIENQDFDNRSDKVWKFVTSGNFREAHMIEPIIVALDKMYEEKEHTFKLIVIGPIALEKLHEFLDRPYIYHIDHSPMEVIAEHLRQSDLFIYSFLNPNCPNAVIEAISCALPIVSFNSGSLPELCYFQKELLAYVSEHVIQHYQDFDGKRLYEKLCQCMEQFSHYRSLSLEHSYLYDNDSVGNEYLKFIESL